MTSENVVKFGDTFYLKHESSGQYLATVDRGRHNWPQLSNTGKVELQLVGGKGDVDNNSYIKIRTTEQVTFNNDILGAFADSRDCYYYKDEYDNAKQGWRITKASGDTGKIFYGDRVRITNIFYSNQRLALDKKHPGYITTVENAGDCWILEPVFVQSVVEPPSSTNVKPINSYSLNVFSWSVASGDPTTTGVILWTRVNPKEYDKNIPLEYEVASDESFQKILWKKEISASNFDEKTDYTVHINLNGQLEPDRYYFYRFIYKGITSPIGRCRTLPTPDKKLNKLTLAVLTCNDYSTGYFNAFYKLAEEKVDFVIHLGDFIYEYPQYPPGYGDIVRKDITLENQQYPYKDPANCDRATSLQHFRHIYQTYRQDPALQKAMEQHTWIIALDDHEIADNCYWDYENNTMGISAGESQPLHPIYENLGKDTPAAKLAMLELYKNATQAWREYVPALFQKIDGSKSDEYRYKLYREFRFGSLVDFFLTDSRSFRNKPSIEPHSQASMLGKDQKNWLINGINSSKASWRVWGNQTFLATALANELIGEIDDWHGFKAERYEILKSIKDQETLKNGTDHNSRFVVFTGDMHTSLVAYLKTETESLQSALVSGILNTLQPGVSDLKSGTSNLASGASNLLSGDLKGAVTDAGEGVLNLGKGALNLGLGGLKAGAEVLSGIGSGITNPKETAQNVVGTVTNSFNYDYSKLAGVEFMTPSVTSPGISEGILKQLESSLPVDILGILEKLSLSTDNSVHQQHSWQHKFVTGSLIKSLSPHIEHYDSRVNGYAIAEFTPEQLTWKVYRVDRTDHDKIQGRNVSTNRAKKELVQSVKYDPNGIKLTDSHG